VVVPALESLETSGLETRDRGHSCFDQGEGGAVDTDRVKGKQEELQGKTRQKWADAKDAAGDTWEDVKDKAEDVVDEGEDRLEREKDAERARSAR
jgi:uncharacterized protein YjbJ (UPF0337 family)